MSDINLFSLEEDDVGEMFLTQQCRETYNEDEQMEESVGDGSFLGLDPMDFESPNVSLVANSKPVYSDISEAEDFETEPVNNSKQG